MSRRHSNQRFQFTGTTADLIWKRDKGTCVYCGKPATEIDHIIPTACFGHATFNNGVLACRSCNMHRRHHPEDLKYLEKAYHHLFKCGVTIDKINPTISDIYYNNRLRYSPIKRRGKRP